MKYLRVLAIISLFVISQQAIAVIGEEALYREFTYNEGFLREAVIEKFVQDYLPKRKEGER